MHVCVCVCVLVRVCVCMCVREGGGILVRVPVGVLKGRWFAGGWVRACLLFYFCLPSPTLVDHNQRRPFPAVVTRVHGVEVWPAVLCLRRITYRKSVLNERLHAGSLCAKRSYGCRGCLSLNAHDTESAFTSLLFLLPLPFFLCAGGQSNCVFPWTSE